MQRLVIGPLDNNDNGFTLIEILVVLVIISIIAAISIYAFGDFGRGRREKIVADLIQRVIPVARQQAILQPAILGLKFTNTGFRFYRFWIDSAEQEGRWINLRDDQLSRSRAFNSQVRVELEEIKGLHANVFDINSKDHPRIIFLPSGYVTPFRLAVKGGGNVIYIISVLDDGSVHLFEREQ